MISRGLALLAGLLLPLLAPWLPELPVPVWVAGAVAAACASLLVRHRVIRLVSAFLLGMLVTGGHAAHWQARELPSLCEREPLAVTGRIDGLPVPVETARGEVLRRVVLELQSVTPRSCRGPRRVEVFWSGEQALVPGQAWALTLRLRRPWGQVNPGGYNPRAAALAAGIHAVGSVSSVSEPRRHPGADTRGGVDGWRLQLAGAIAPELPAAGLLRALAIADRSAVEPSQWQLFQQFGVAHLLVISGLHVGMVAAFGGLLGAALARLPGCAGQVPRPAVLSALVLATLYTSLAGWSVPTTRAWVMLACSLSASLAGRPAWAPVNLLRAALVLLLCNPFSALSAGFWLSFGAVAALFWLAHWRARGGLAARLGLAHLFVCLAMFPLGGIWFGFASLIAPLANLLLVPPAGLLVVPLVLGGVLAWPLSPALAESAWSLAGSLLAWLLLLMQRLAEPGGASLTLPVQVSVPAVALAVLGLCLVVLPMVWPRRLLAALLLLPLLLPWREQRVDSRDAVHVLLLDVGQGSAVLIHDRQRALLYDTGSVGAVRSAVLPVLQRRGIRRLDSLVVSHGDADHAGGLELLGQTLEVDQLLLGADLAPANVPAGLRAEDSSGRVVHCRAGQAWSWAPGLWFRVLAPAPGEVISTRNAGSCVLQASLWGHRLLLAGDIDAPRERELLRYWGTALRSDWATAPHHGSASSSSWAWLKGVGPDLVVYSHGRANPFGHPAPEVRQRHYTLGIPTESTAAGGALEWIIEPGAAPRFRAYRRIAPRFWWGG